MAKQLKLDFGKSTDTIKPAAEEDSHPTKMLIKPSDSTLREREDILIMYTKSTLLDNAAFFVGMIKKYSFRYKDGDSGQEATPEIIRKFEKTTNQPKDCWAELLAWFYDEHNIKLLLDELTPQELELIKDITRNSFLSEEKLKEIFGKSCIDKDYWGHPTIRIPDNIDKLCITRYSRSLWTYRDTIYLCFNSLMQQLLLKTFYADTLQAPTTDTLPDEANLNVYTNEPSICMQMPILASLYDTHVIPNTLGKLLVGQIKKAQKVLNIPEIFEVSKDKKTATLCISGLLYYYMIYRAYVGKKVPPSPENIIKDFVTQRLTFQSVTLPIIFPHLKGFKKYRLNSGFFNDVTIMLQRVLKRLATGGWANVNSVILQIRTYNYQSDYRFSLIESRDLDDMVITNGYGGREEVICLDTIIRQLSEPYVRAVLVVLTTLGVVEVAYRTPKSDDNSCYDTIEYVRVTELGKYVFGLTDKYTPQADKDRGPAFELDNERLIIRVIDKSSPFISLVEDYANKISPTLYRVNNEAFLKECSNITDLDRKIKIFNTYICPDPPKVWRQFFNELFKKCNPFVKTEIPYTILNIPRDNKELQRIVLTEPSVRKFVVKAENYTILIKQSELSQFASALKKFGYIL